MRGGLDLGFWEVVLFLVGWKYLVLSMGLVVCVMFVIGWLSGVILLVGSIFDGILGVDWFIGWGSIVWCGFGFL